HGGGIQRRRPAAQPAGIMARYERPEPDGPPGGRVDRRQPAAHLHRQRAKPVLPFCTRQSVSSAASDSSSLSLNTCTPWRRKAAVVTPSPATREPLKLPS